MTKRILIIDDDTNALLLVSKILGRGGYRILEATSGPQGLHLATTEKPDLVLVDVNMPGMDGYEVVRRMRGQTQTAHLPILMLTARSGAADRTEGLLAGADDYITKPVEPADLTSRVAAVLARADGTHPLPGDLLKEIANSAVLTLDAELVWLLAADDTGRQLHSAAVASASGEDATRRWFRAVKGAPGEVVFPIAPGINPLTDVLLTQTAVVDEGLRALSQRPGGELLRRGLDAIGALWVTISPLLTRGQRLGVMLVARRADSQWGSRDVQVVKAIANQAAIALDNLRLMRNLEQSEREVRQAELFHQTLVNSMGDGLLVLDRWGKIQFVNRRLCRMLDYAEADLLGRPYLNFLHPDDRSAAGSALTQPGRMTTSFERRLVHRSGRVLPALIAHVPTTRLGADTGDILVVTDLSEIKMREEALRRKNMLLGAVERAARAMVSSLDLNAVPRTILAEAVNVLQVKGGSILLLEDATGDLVFESAVGTGAEKLIGARVPAGRGLVGWVVQTAQSALVDDIRQDKRFYRGIDQTTGLTTTSVMAVPLLSHGKVIGVLEVVNRTEGEFTQEDLQVLESLASSAAVAIENARLYRDLRLHAVELETAYDELKAADQVKDELIQNVSHELRTPLTFILGYVELLLEGELGPLSAEQIEGLTLVRKKCFALAKVVNDIVSMQEMSIAALLLRPVDIVGLAHQSVRACAIVAEQNGLSVELLAPSGLPPIPADEERLGQVLDNLLGNAIKFSPQGGRITVRIHDEPRQAKVEVRDTGIGIPQDKLGKVFERFYQVDGSATRRYGGVGLGLAICKEIVAAHGGEIWAESEPNKGSAFFFTVPKSRQARPLPEPALGDRAAVKSGHG